MRLIAVVGLFASTAILIVATTALRVWDQPAAMRAVLAMLPAIFWAATIASALERLLSDRWRSAPLSLALIGSTAIALAEWLALSAR